MKLFKPLCLILSLTLLLSACAPAQTSREDGNYRIVASFAPIYAITLSITQGAENISLDCMASSSTGCLHDYQLTAADMQRLEGADLFIIGGAGMEESFFDKLTLQYPDMPVLTSSDGINTISHGEEENSHLWLSTQNAVKIAESIANSLCERNAANADIYEANLDKFRREINALYEEYSPLFAEANNKKIITFHESFEYLAKEFGVEVAAVIETEPGTAPDPKTLSELIELAKEGGVAAIFTEPQYPDDTARVISDETGVPVLNLDPIVTGDMDADTFVNTLKKDLKILSDAVK